MHLEVEKDSMEPKTNKNEKNGQGNRQDNQ